MAIAVVGVTSGVAQIIVPMSSLLSAEHERAGLDPVRGDGWAGVCTLGGVTAALGLAIWVDVPGHRMIETVSPEAVSTTRSRR
ncbi:MAG: hypothetical protein ABI427_01140 [Solirubrobacteraceae bacterium]